MDSKAKKTISVVIGTRADAIKMMPVYSALQVNTGAAFGDLLRREKPDCVLVHGDTASSYGVSVAAFYQRIKIGHVEAGLRTTDLKAPFPEEYHRQAISLIADIHFAPSGEAQNDLVKKPSSDC